jgi:hypothetical protein
LDDIAAELDVATTPDQSQRTLQRVRHARKRA